MFVPTVGGENTNVMLCAPGVADDHRRSARGDGPTTTGADGADGGPNPTRFRAMTVHV